MGDRDRLVSVRLTQGEYDRLSESAAVCGCDRSTLLRRLIADAPLYRVVVWQQETAPLAALNDLSAVLRQRITGQPPGA